MSSKPDMMKTTLHVRHKGYNQNLYTVDLFIKVLPPLDKDNSKLFIIFVPTQSHL